MLKANGLALGEEIGQAVIDLRANDGWDGFDNYVGSEQTGLWRPTPPMFSLPASPQWCYVAPWVLSAADQFRPAGPPPMTSEAYAADVAEVAELGRVDSQTRTEDQSEIALFWLDGAGTYTPPGHWNSLANRLIADTGASAAESARLLAQLNMALADCLDHVNPIDTVVDFMVRATNCITGFTGIREGLAAIYKITQEAQGIISNVTAAIESAEQGATAEQIANYLKIFNNAKAIVESSLDILVKQNPLRKALAISNCLEQLLAFAEGICNQVDGKPGRDKFLWKIHRARRAA